MPGGMGLTCVVDMERGGCALIMCGFVYWERRYCFPEKRVVLMLE